MSPLRIALVAEDYYPQLGGGVLRFSRTPLQPAADACGSEPVCRGSAPHHDGEVDHDATAASSRTDLSVPLVQVPFELTSGSRIKKPKLMARYAGKWLKPAEPLLLEAEGTSDESAGKVENPSRRNSSDTGSVNAEATMVATMPALLRPPVSLLALSSALSLSMVRSANMTR